MKIGILCYPSIGGSGVVATELGKALSRRGHQIHFFSYDVPRKLEGATEEFRFHHVDVPLYPLFRFPPYTLALASSIYHTSLANPLDILHVHYAVPHSTSALLAKFMLCSRGEHRMKVITTLHGTDTELVGQMPSYKPVVEYSVDSSSAVTAVSEYLKKATQREFEIHKEIQVIYNPIDTDTFSPPTDEAEDGSPVKTIVHISNFRPVKRIYDVIKVFNLIAAAMPAQLVFIGEGPDRSTADMQICRLGLTEKVKFLGPLTDVAEILKNADLLLSTSESESFGLTIAEAMACEVPVVATDVGGIPEVVENGVSGFLAPVGDIQKLAEAAIRILSNPILGKTMARAARQRILDRFSIDQITDQYEALYDKVIQAKEEECPHHEVRMARLAQAGIKS